MANGVLPAAGTKIVLNGVTLCMSEWEVVVDPGLVDATTFCDFSSVDNTAYGDWIATVRDARITVRGFWNILQNPHVAPPAITGGAVLTNLFFYLNMPAAVPLWQFPNVIICEVRCNAMVRDALKFDFDARSKGRFIYPGLA